MNRGGTLLLLMAMFLTMVTAVFSGSKVNKGLASATTQALRRQPNATAMPPSQTVPKFTNSDRRPCDPPGATLFRPDHRVAAGSGGAVFFETHYEYLDQNVWLAIIENS